MPKTLLAIAQSITKYSCFSRVQATMVRVYGKESIPACDATILSSRFVLTAASCLFRVCDRGTWLEPLRSITTLIGLLELVLDNLATYLPIHNIPVSHFQQRGVRVRSHPSPDR